MRTSTDRRRLQRGARTLLVGAAVAGLSIATALPGVAQTADQDSQSSTTQRQRADSFGDAFSFSGESSATGATATGDQNSTTSSNTNQNSNTTQDATTDNDADQDNDLDASGDVSSSAEASPSASNGGGTNVAASVNLADNSSDPAAGNNSTTGNVGGADNDATQTNTQASSVEGPDQADCNPGGGGMLVGGLCLQAPIGSSTEDSGDQSSTQSLDQTATNDQHAEANPVAASDIDNNQLAESSATQSADDNEICAGCNSTTSSSAVGHAVQGSNSADQLGGVNDSDTSQGASTTQRTSQERTLRSDVMSASGSASADNDSSATTGDQDQEQRHRSTQSAFTLGLL